MRKTGGSVPYSLISSHVPGVGPGQIRTESFHMTSPMLPLCQVRSEHSAIA